MALIDHLHELSDGAKLLAQFEVGEAHKQNLWKKMVEFANPHGDPFSAFLEKECELLDLQEKLGKVIRDKKGRVILSKMFDSKAAYSTYRSTKATILGAKNNGISLTNTDGSIKGKTVIAKELRAIKKSDKSLWQEAYEISNKLSKLLPLLTPVERIALRNYLFTGLDADETKT